MVAKTTVPTRLKVLKGTAQKCRINDQEPEYDTENIKKPTGMSKKASEKWDEIFPVLQSVKVMTVGDVDTLKKYCEACVMLDVYTRELADKPIVYDDHGCPSANPVLRAQSELSKQFLNYTRELGLSPASRTKVKTTEKKKSDNGFGGI